MFYRPVPRAEDISANDWLSSEKESSEIALLIVGTSLCSPRASSSPMLRGINFADRKTARSNTDGWRENEAGGVMLHQMIEVSQVRGLWGCAQ
jgi:hypothetical protein